MDVARRAEIEQMLEEEYADYERWAHHGSDPKSAIIRELLDEIDRLNAIIDGADVVFAPVTGEYIDDLVLLDGTLRDAENDTPPAAMQNGDAIYFSGWCYLPEQHRAPGSWLNDPDFRYPTRPGGPLEIHRIELDGLPEQHHPADVDQPDREQQADEDDRDLDQEHERE